MWPSFIVASCNVVSKFTLHCPDATLFDPNLWANIFSLAGAQYVVLTSKHHEGYCMWDSRSIPSTWNWNAMDVGPRRDLLGELAEAVRKSVSIHTKKQLKFGAYHSLYEW
jgi:alpha-L-fucosidase